LPIGRRSYEVELHLDLLVDEDAVDEDIA